MDADARVVAGLPTVYLLTSWRAESVDAEATEAAQVMARYCRGEAAAFQRLYALMAPRLLAYLVGLGRDKAAAEDAYALRLKTPASLQLLSLDFDFSTLLADVAADRPYDTPRAVETLVAVARSRYRVRMHNLERWSFAFLRQLGTPGCNVRDATSQVADELGLTHDAVGAQLLAWLPFAFEAGFVMPA